MLPLAPGVEAVTRTTGEILKDEGAAVCGISTESCGCLAFPLFAFALKSPGEPGARIGTEAVVLLTPQALGAEANVGRPDGVRDADAAAGAVPFGVGSLAMTDDSALFDRLTRLTLFACRLLVDVEAVGCARIGGVVGDRPRSTRRQR